MKRYVPKWLLITYLCIFTLLAVGSTYIWVNPPKIERSYDCNDMRQRFINYAGRFTLDTYTNLSNNAAQDKQDAFKLILTYPVCFPEELIQEAMMGYKR